VSYPTAREHHFLFLQGLRSPFFWRLGKALSEQGARVTKVNFTGGDHLYWPGVARRCKVAEPALADYYERLLSGADFTDVVLFGDCRPVHQPAIAQAKSLGLRVHVFEEGYFRPDWVTLERDGVNANSLLPRDPHWYERVKNTVARAPKPVTVGPSMTQRVLHDVAYNAGNLFNPVFYRDYNSHVPHSIPAEYWGYIKRYVRVHATRDRDHATVKRLCSNTQPFFLVALQVPGDSQLTVHSPYGSSQAFLAEVFESFAQHADKSCLLVVKSHPLDPGLEKNAQIVALLAKQHQISDRVVFLDSGNLPELLEHAQGLVTVNSTTIGQALFHHCPTIALGKSIYALPGLTYQGRLDEFWWVGRDSMQAQPDQSLYQAFKRVVIHSTQVNGGLYTDRGMRLAITHALPHLLTAKGKLQALLEQYPCEPQA